MYWRRSAWCSAWPIFSAGNPGAARDRSRRLRTPRRRATFAGVFVAMAITLHACAPGGAGVEADNCGPWLPIAIDDSELSDDLARQILEHNETWLALCGAKFRSQIYG